MSNLYFKDVIKNQINLTKDEEIKLFDAYQHCRDALEKEIFLNDLAVKELLKIYSTIVKTNKSIAKLSRDFNTNKKGLNLKISNSYREKIPLYCQIKDKNKRAEKLKSLRLSKTTYNSILNKIEKEDIPNIELIRILKLTMGEVADKAVKSCLKAAITIAHSYNIPGINVNVEDLIQEANIGFYDAVDLYNPNHRTKDGNRVKFFTYAYYHAERQVKEWIRNQSREIRLPKSRLEIIFSIIKISKNKSIKDKKTLTTAVNKLLRQNNKLKLTYKEIEEAIELFQNNTVNIHNSPGSKNDGDKPQALEDILHTQEKSIEEKIIEREKRQALCDIFENNLPKELYNIIYFRYLHEDSKVTLENTAEKLYINKVTPKKLSRESIRYKEEEAFNILRKKSPRLKQILQNIILENIN